MTPSLLFEIYDGWCSFFFSFYVVTAQMKIRGRKQKEIVYFITFFKKKKNVLSSSGGKVLEGLEYFQRWVVCSRAPCALGKGVARPTVFDSRAAKGFVVPT
jgi:hypothetical protein